MLTFPLHVVIDAFCDNLDANFSDCYCYQQVFIQPQDVGKLRKIRIWHDNTEEHPGWYLQKVRACAHQSRVMFIRCQTNDHHDRSVNMALSCPGGDGAGGRWAEARDDRQSLAASRQGRR